MHNFSGSTSYKVSDSIVTDLKKINSKDYYQLYVNATKIEPTGQKKWLKDLNLKIFNWNLAFTQISKTCKENKLRKELYACVIEKTVKVFIVMNPTPFCIPLLIVKRLCPSLIKLFPGLTKQTIKKKKLPKFNYCLLFAKYFLYCQKLS